MQLNDTNDDLALPKNGFNVIACVAVHGRLPLLKHTIERLYKKNGCYKVICSGDGLEEKKLCESLGAVWVPAKNKPLGAKWNAAFMKAKSFYPDAVLYVGSSDFVSDNWITVMKPYVENYDFVGAPGCHFLDIGDEMRVCFWPGYKFSQFHKDRGTETIGIGRMISARLMNKIGWQPFDNNYDNSLDRSMKERCKKYGLVDDYMVNENIKAVSISTNRWANKHNFTSHWAGAIPSERLDDVYTFVNANFPEVNDIFK